VAYRLGIDGRMLSPQPKGIGRYIWELCKALDKVMPDAEFLIYSRQPTSLPRISERWRECVDPSGTASRLPSSAWGVSRVGFLARRDKVNTFWGGTGLIPLAGLTARSVLTVHDLVHRIEPKTTSLKARWAARLFFRASVRSADAIVCNSQGSARRLEQFLGRAADAIVRPGVSGSFRRKTEAEIVRVLRSLGISRPYLLTVGTWEPRKGLQRLIPAFLTLSAGPQLSKHTLVVAGERGWKDKSIVKLVQESGERIRATGFVDDESLAALYSGADALIFPSSYEGFGIPVLEARACATRVVATDLAELREAGGEGTIYVPPTQQGIQLGILRALASPRPKPIAASKSSWIESARVLAKVFTSADCTVPSDVRSIAPTALNIDNPTDFGRRSPRQLNC
jgi:glycosyltransferase involved in cell wall biosynthesis